MPNEESQTAAQGPRAQNERWWNTIAAGVLIVSVAIIWWTKFQVTEPLYVSGLGATSMPTAPLFNTALLGIGLGGLLGAPALRRIHSGWPWLSWSASITLVVTSVAFIGASRVTCTYGCPIPFTPGSTVQDLIHIVFASAGFTGAAVVMLQVATSSARRTARAIAWCCAAGTGVVSAAGAMLSLLRLHTDIGALLEFVAMSVGVGWLAFFLLAEAFAGSASTSNRGRGTTAKTYLGDEDLKGPQFHESKAAANTGY